MLYLVLALLPPHRLLRASWGRCRPAGPGPTTTPWQSRKKKKPIVSTVIPWPCPTLTSTWRASRSTSGGRGDGPKTTRPSSPRSSPHRAWGIGKRPAEWATTRNATKIICSSIASGTSSAPWWALRVNRSLRRPWFVAFWSFGVFWCIRVSSRRLWWSFGTTGRIGLWSQQPPLVRW